MTELREPPLLSEEEITQTIIDATMRTTAPKSAWKAMCQAQREADIKWMKEHCYLKAERELPKQTYEMRHSSKTGRDYLHGGLSTGYEDAQQDMLEAGFRAVKEFKDD